MVYGTKGQGFESLTLRQKKVLLSTDKRAFFNDAFLAEHDAHFVRDAGVARDAHLRRVGRTHCITYHSVAVSLFTLLRSNIFCDIIGKKGVYVVMPESKLKDLSLAFAIDIIELVKNLKSAKESIISNQIGRSGTSIGANIHEAQYAQGKKDFVSKLEIALKEASETGYWLELLRRTNYIDEQTYKTLSTKCTSLRAMLVASCKTTKSNMGD